MKVRPKVVVDTNVFVSALLKSKICKFIYEELKRDSFELVISPQLLLEIERVVKNEKFELDDEEIRDLIVLLKRKVLLLPTGEKVEVCRDPKDNCVLECAIAGKVDIIVTGDKDLLILSPFRGILIVSPSEFSRLFLLR